MLPEWRPSRAVILAWPYPHGDWRNNYEQVVECYWQLLRGLSSLADVWLLLHPSIDANTWHGSTHSDNINWPRVKLFNCIDYNDTWVRDYGPISLNNKYLSYEFNGWGGKYPAGLDNQVTQLLFAELKEPIDSIGFVCEGGALETNGQVLLLNQDCIVGDSRNPGLSKADAEQHLKQTLGVSHIHWIQGIQLSGDDTDGHIDTIARFADKTRVIYSGRNSVHPDAGALLSLSTQLQALAQDRQWTLYELPTPVFNSSIDGRLLPASYANFLILNDTVVVPTYGIDEDAVALRVFAQAFESYRLLPIRCDALLEQHGSLHCATMQVAWLDQ